jgi:hypothetical protein
MSRKLRELKARYGVTERSAVAVNDMDPTTSKKYLEWLFKVKFTRLPNGKSRVKEDFPATLKNNVKTALAWYERNSKNKVPEDFRDINKFNTIVGFLTKVGELNVPSRKEIKDNVRVVLDNERWKIVVPLAHDSARLYGSGTRWCTTQKTYYTQYTRNGLLYYIIDKTLNRKFGLPVRDNNTGNVSFGENFFNNEDIGLRLANIKNIYGANFDVVTDAIKVDFRRYTMDKLKRKALEDAVKRVEATKREFARTKLGNDKIEELFNALVNEVNGLSNEIT